MEGDVVTPWQVAASDAKGVDYDKLVDKFGCHVISPELIARFERATGHRAHRFIRRGLFFAHRDLERICTAKEKGQPIYLYTGRGPANASLHVGHLVPFMMTQWLQEALDAILVIQITDDEKFVFKEDLGLEECSKLAIENIRDILACGFNVDKTFVFRNTDFIGALYPVILKIQKKTTFNQVKGIFGFGDSDNIGKVAFPAVQAAPAFSAAFPNIFGGLAKPTDVECLIPCAIDQDPYFRMARDLAPRLGWRKPCLILSKFLPSLHGSQTKMSGSVETSAVYMTDTPKQIKTKINKYAFSGGKDTAEEQRISGANLEVDVPFRYLTFLLEDDDELTKIEQDYSTGKMLTGEVKARLIQILIELVAKHQERRASVTDDILYESMKADRKFELRAKQQATPVEAPLAKENAPSAPSAAANE